VQSALPVQPFFPLHPLLPVQSDLPVHPFLPLHPLLVQQLWSFPLQSDLSEEGELLLAELEHEQVIALAVNPINASFTTSFFFI